MIYGFRFLATEMERILKFGWLIKTQDILGHVAGVYAWMS